MENVKEISLGNAHSGAIKEDGSLWMWGWNINGQLGDGTTEEKHTPVKVMENVKMIDDDSDGNPRVEITMNDFLK